MRTTGPLDHLRQQFVLAADHLADPKPEIRRLLEACGTRPERVR